MTITLTPEMDEIVAKKIHSGRYATSQEVVEQALHWMDAHEEARAADLAEFQQELDERIESMDRGEFADPEEVFARLRERSRLLRQNAA